MYIENVETMKIDFTFQNDEASGRRHHAEHAWDSMVVHLWVENGNDSGERQELQYIRTNRGADGGEVASRAPKTLVVSS